MENHLGKIEVFVKWMKSILDNHFQNRFEKFISTEIKILIGLDIIDVFYEGKLDLFCESELVESISVIMTLNKQ